MKKQSRIVKKKKGRGTKSMVKIEHDRCPVWCKGAN